MSQSEESPLEVQIDLALAEYMQKCDSGLAPDRDTFLAQHPGLREQLQELLAAADWIESLAGPRLADLAADGGATSPSEQITHKPSDTDSNPNVESAVAPHQQEQPPRLQAFAALAPMDAHGTTEETLPQGVRRAGRTEETHETLPQGTAGPAPDFSMDERAAPRELTQPALPCRFGDYMLEKILGRGGMGVVYYARQIQLDRPVAIKMIRSGALASHEEVLRFYAEARSAARLDHPNIVTVYQCGECEGHHYFSMDFVDGTDLSKLAQHSPLDCKRAARYVRDAARAIQYAHERGILHRDLKPANVLIDKADQVHITDFGLAKTVGTETGLTASGAALGTPSYMSPEQAAGRLNEQHQATDIYSLGAVLFTIVTGQPPFKGTGIVQTIMHVIHRPAPLAGSIRSDLPEDLETIIDVCLQKSPDRRYPSAAALADDLHRFLHGMPIQARPASRWRRAWYWVLGIPVIGAVLDHRVVEPTDAHRWVQRGLISVALLCVLMWLMTLIPASAWMSNRFPKSVRIAGGAAGGNYAQLAQAISAALAAQRVSQSEAIETFGSSDNAERLQRREVDLALLQSDTLSLPDIAVVAPLYYEAVHILVKSDLGVKSLADLRHRRMMLGSEKSGARRVARLLFQRAGMDLNDFVIDQGEWHGLLTQPSADACIVVTKKGASDLVAVLATGHYCLLPVADSLQFALDEPIFHPVLLDIDSYPNCNLPPDGIASIAITAFLACRVDAPPILIQTVLENLFLPDFVRENGILAAEWASRWPGSTWHPAAREFFQAYHGSPIHPR